MQRHFSSRGEALAESAAAKSKTIPPAQMKGQSTKNSVPLPWPKQTSVAAVSTLVEKGRTSAKEGLGASVVATRSFQVQAGTLAELLEKAAHALVALDGRPSHSEWFVRRTVEVQGSDRESLLANWLNEVLLREQTAHELYDQFVVKEICGNYLRAQLYGRKSKKHITPIKKVTLLSLIEQPASGLLATIVADVRVMD